MNVFEKIKERLKEADKYHDRIINLGDALRIVSEVEAEYINKSTEHINKSSDCSSGWIPCSERLPEPHRTVAITYKSKNAIGCSLGYISIRDRRWHYHQNTRVRSEVIAWMPLPEPYRRKEQG